MRRCFVLAVCCLLQSVAVSLSAERQTVTLTIREVIERPALWSDAGGTKAVVLMHQSGSSAESWQSLAQKLHSAGLSTIAPASNSGEDALAAIAFLLDHGKTDITLLGASIGGGAVQQAVAKAPRGTVSRVILLSTATGPALESPKVSKLFVHAEGDFFLQRSVLSFEKAADPKRLLVFDGSEHGQELLKGDHRDQLEAQLLDFVLE